MERERNLLGQGVECKMTTSHMLDLKEPGCGTLSCCITSLNKHLLHLVFLPSLSVSTCSKEEDSQTAEMAGGVVPCRVVSVGAPARPEQLHVRGAQDRGGHCGVWHGPR